MTSSKGEPTIILGVDPGTIVTGYAIIKATNRSLEPIDFGCIRPPKKALLSDRYHIIYTSLLHLIEQFSPTELAIEQPFINKNPQSALKLGSALGCAIIAAKNHSLTVFGYSPAEVKKGIIGIGDASKEHIEAIVSKILSISFKERQLDASDALSLAIYHSRCRTTKKEL